MLCVLYIHDLLQLTLRLSLKLFCLLSQKLFIPKQVIRDYKRLKLDLLGRKFRSGQMIFNEAIQLYLVVGSLDTFLRLRPMLL